jgi:hypothetical protein
MKFFIPQVDDKNEAEKFYNDMKTFAKDNLQWEITERRIFKIKYEHGSKRHNAEVGDYDTMTGEIVLAIFESQSYLICTPNRGGLKGTPILAGSPFSVTDFEQD